jgi:HEPN domain-containing protein
MSWQSWFAQAESDLAAARLLSDGKYHSQAIWLASQAVEKGTKAILVALGLQYGEADFKRMNHNSVGVARILPEALQAPLDPNIALKTATLQTKAERSRYPSPPQAIGKGAELVAPSDDMTSSETEVADATLLLEWCRERIGRAESAVVAMKPLG